MFGKATKNHILTIYKKCDSKCKLVNKYAHNSKNFIIQADPSSFKKKKIETVQKMFTTSNSWMQNDPHQNYERLWKNYNQYLLIYQKKKK